MLTEYFIMICAVLTCVKCAQKVVSPTVLVISRNVFKMFVYNVFAIWGHCGALFMQWTPDKNLITFQRFRKFSNS